MSESANESSLYGITLSVENRVVVEVREDETLEQAVEREVRRTMHRDDRYHYMIDSDYEFSNPKEL